MTVATASEQASSNVQTVASAAEQLSHFDQRDRPPGGEIEPGRRGCRAPGRRDQRHHAQPAEAAHRIGEVVRLINDIAQSGPICWP